MRLAMNRANALAPAQKTCRRVMPAPSGTRSKDAHTVIRRGEPRRYGDHPDVTDWGATRDRPKAPRCTVSGKIQEPRPERGDGDLGLNSWFGKLDTSGTLMTMKPLPVLVWHALHPA